MFKRIFGFHSLLAIVVFIDLIHAASKIETSERKLSRKRRYLIFPMGSSLQLGNILTIHNIYGQRLISLVLYFIQVYDSVLTIPDYSIYVLTGVTVALAWGLPDKPIYPETDFMEQHENERISSLQRNDKNVTKSDGNGEIRVSTPPPTTGNNRPNPAHTSQNDDVNKIVNRISNFYKYFQRRKPDSYYSHRTPLNPANYNRKESCNNRYCANGNYYSYGNNPNSGGYNATNVRPPYSASYDAIRRYDGFEGYMNDISFQPWAKTGSNLAKSTTVPPTTTSTTT